MKKVLAFIMVLLLFTSCGTKDAGTMEKDGDGIAINTPFLQYVDSIKKVFPNYKGNIAALRKISEDLEHRLTTLPGVLDGAEFHIVGIAEIEGKINVMFTHIGVRGEHEACVSLVCDDFGLDNAAKLDESKNYRVVSGKVDSVRCERAVAPKWLEFGVIYVSDLKVEETSDYINEEDSIAYNPRENMM